MDNRKVRRVVKTPDETYISQWYVQKEPYNLSHINSIISPISSSHPQDEIFIVRHQDISYGIHSDKSISVQSISPNFAKVTTLPIDIELESGDWVTIPPSIVEQSVIICEFEKG